MILIENIQTKMIQFNAFKCMREERVQGQNKCASVLTSIKIW